MCLFKEGITMDKNQFKGKLKQAKGAIEEGYGKVTGSDKHIAKGKLDKKLGKVQEKYGDFKEHNK